MSTATGNPSDSTEPGTTRASWQARLAQCTPLDARDPQRIGDALAQTQIVRVPRNLAWPIAEVPEHLIYLIEGRAVLDQGGRPLVVMADSERARRPLLDDALDILDGPLAALESLPLEDPAEDAGSAPDRLLVAEGTVLALVPLAPLMDDAPGTDAFTLTEEDLDADGAELVERLFEAYRADALTLPPMPEVAVRLRRLLEDPEVEINDVARVAQSDAVLAGGLVRAANSALFTGVGRASTVREAVGRLGLRTTQQLSLAIGLSTVFEATDPFIRRRMHEEWQRSVHVAATSFVVARHRPGIDPEQALLAGLLHRIGAVPLLCLMDAQETPPAPEAIPALVDTLCTAAGELVVNDWRLSETVQEVVTQITHWDREAAPTPTYLDLVQLALLMARADDDPAADLDAAAATAAGRSFGFADGEALRSWMQDLASEIAAARELLMQ